MIETHIICHFLAFELTAREPHMLSQNSLIAILGAADSNARQNREIDRTGNIVAWLPIFEYKNHNYGIVLETGEWTSEYSDHQRVARTGVYVGFLVLLELPFRELGSLISKAIVRKQLPAIIATTFPMDQIVETGLASSAYWSSLAYEWLNSGYPPNDQIAKLAPRHQKVLAWQRHRINEIFGEIF